MGQQFTIGIDIGGTNLVAGAVDADNRLVVKVSQKADRVDSADALCRVLNVLLEQALEAAHLQREDISHIGIGVPGSVDVPKGEILFCPNLPLRNVPLREQLSQTWDVPIELGNDAHCALVGEYYAGAIQNCRSAVVVTLGTGVGLGVMMEGPLFLGAAGRGMEGGHMVIVADGQPCNCGRRGCWEQYASATGLRRLTREGMSVHPESSMWQACQGSLDNVGGRTAFQAARAGDAAGLLVVQQYLHYLAIGLTNLVNLFQPEVLCLGGGVSNEGDDLFLDPLKDLVNGECYNHQGTYLRKCQLGNDAGILGAALLHQALSHHQFIRNP